MSIPFRVIDAGMLQLLENAWLLALLCYSHIPKSFPADLRAPSTFYR